MSEKNDFSLAQWKLEMSFVVMPKDANHYGNVHGGVIMKHADDIAYALASKFSRMNVVTARLSELDFINPVKVGDMVILSAGLVRVGKSSMDIHVHITGDKLTSGELFEVANARFTMVAVDDVGKPKPIGTV